MAIFKKPNLKEQTRKKRDIPHGLFQKCPGCGEVVHEIELTQNLRVCPRCDYHFAWSAKERIDHLLDPGSFVETDADLKSVDTLRFHGLASYKERLKTYQERTGLVDAVISGQFATGCVRNRQRD
jgi:acetyl-CoA carboxylase carboxyl transferase subunit beta